MSKEMVSVTSLKGVCAVLVVMIHTHLIGQQIFIPFYRCAVPLFFMTSGYFLMGADGRWRRDRMGGHIRRMCRILLATDLIYVALALCIFRDDNLLPGIGGGKSWSEAILTECLVGGQFCGPLWYVTAYLQALVVLKLWKRRVGERLYVGIILILLLSNLLLGTYDFLFPSDVTASWANRNLFTSALPFIMLGGYVRRHERSLIGRLPRSKTFYLLLLSAAYAELLCLYFADSRNGDVFVMTPVLSVTALLWFAARPDFRISPYIYDLGKKHSLNIYLSHAAIIWAVNAVCQELSISIRSIEFFIVLALTLALCSLIGKFRPVAGLRK